MYALVRIARNRDTARVYWRSGRRPHNDNRSEFPHSRATVWNLLRQGSKPSDRVLLLTAGNFFELGQWSFKLIANIVSNADSNLPGGISGTRERAFVGLLCLLAAVHVFVFSAAFPFFNNVDEQIHFDLVVKWSQGHVVRALEPVSDEAVRYIVLYGSPEYVGIPTNAPDGQFAPPPWKQPLEKVRPALIARTLTWRAVTNYEVSQPPLYYALAGLWWRLGEVCGFHDGYLLYWLRFLNVFFIAALVWLGFAAARMIFPDNLFLQLGVPALIAFMPQTAFYSIQNDVLSPLCFGAAFILLVRWLQAELPGVRPGIFAGLALAATFLTKISNAPLLAVSALAVLLKVWRLFRVEKLRAATSAILSFALCAGLPIALWLVWCRINFGDFTGSEAKVKFLGWTPKPFAEWWHHPVFTLHGFWVFLSGNLATLWQGEFLWHRQPLAIREVDSIYAILSVGLVALALVALLQRPAVTTTSQWQVLMFALGCLVAVLAFFGWLSIIYDFQNCFYPSRAHPYFTSGRLLLGALIPFLLLFLFGLDQVLVRFSNSAKFFILTGLILFMLISEVTVDWTVFANPYNWFHL